MTVTEFRNHKFLPQQWAKELQTNGLLQLVMEVMEQNHPARYAVPTDIHDDLSPTRAALELGLTRGYSKYGDTLKLLASPTPKTGELGEPTYETPPEELNHARTGHSAANANH